jgi:hypothetical protein
MTKKVAFWIFLLGTLSSAVVFLAATLDTHQQLATLSNAYKLSDQVVAGKRAFESTTATTATRSSDSAPITPRPDPGGAAHR